MPDYLVDGFFAKVGAWHNKGTVASRRLTREEAYNLSGQNYDVIRRPIHVDGKEVTDHFATVRADNGAVLGIVGDQYKIIQNKSLYDILEPVVSEGEAVYETGGVLKGGAVVWALAQLEKHHFAVGKEDLVKMYTLTALAHDGSRPFTGAPTAIRVVCWNTLSLALGIADTLADNMIRIAHKGNTEYQLRTAHHLLGMASKNSNEWNEFFNAIAQKQMNNALVQEFAAAMFPSKKEDDGKPAGVLIARQRAEIRMGFEAEINNVSKDVQHTGWSAYNALTDYVDHTRPMRRGNERQFFSLFGGGQTTRVRAVRWLGKELLGKTI